MKCCLRLVQSSLVLTRHTCRSVNTKQLFCSLSNSRSKPVTSLANTLITAVPSHVQIRLISDSSVNPGLSIQIGSEEEELMSPFLRDKVTGVDSGKKKIAVLKWDEEKMCCLEEEVLKADLMDQAAVPARDLRKLVSVSKRKQISSLFVRQKCIIVHMEHVKALILHNQMFIFGVKQGDPKLRHFVRFLPSLLYQSERIEQPSPFELRAVEAVLIEATESLDLDLKILHPIVLSLIETLSVDQSARKMKEFMAAIDSVDGLLARVQSLKQALSDILLNDEDLAAMFLSEKHQGVYRSVDDHGEAETLLENYVMQADETEQRVMYLSRLLQTQETFLKIHFDSQRNRLMRMNLLASFGSFSAGLTAAGASMFGMNLQSGLESHPFAFYMASAGLAGLGVASFSSLFFVYMRSKTTGNILRDRLKKQQQAVRKSQ